MDRVIILIDSNSLHNQIKRFIEKNFGIKDFKPDVDYEKLRDILANSRKLIRVYFYYPKLPAYFNSGDRQAQNKLIALLQSIDYFEVQEGRLQGHETFCKHCGKKTKHHEEKKVDVLITTTLLKMAYRDTSDVFVLLTSDADFSPAVKAAKDTGKHIELVIMKGEEVWELKNVCDKITSLDHEVLKQFLKNYPSGQPTLTSTGATSIP